MGPGPLTVALSRLQGTRATDELRQLLFGMVDSLSVRVQTQAGPPAGGWPSVSPVKDPARRPAGTSAAVSFSPVAHVCLEELVYLMKLACLTSDQSKLTVI